MSDLTNRLAYIKSQAEGISLRDETDEKDPGPSPREKELAYLVAYLAAILQTYLVAYLAAILQTHLRTNER